MRHDDRRGAGDRNEADLEVLFFWGRRLGEDFRGAAKGEKLRNGSQRGGRTQFCKKGPSCAIVGQMACTTAVSIMRSSRCSCEAWAAI